jgi:hypothetical protein
MTINVKYVISKNKCIEAILYETNFINLQKY